MLRTLHTALLFFLVVAVSCGQRKKTPTAQEEKPFFKKERKDSTRFTHLVPEPAGFVSDFANVISEEDEVYMAQRIVEHEKNTSNQVAIITLTLDSTQVFAYPSPSFDSLTLELVQRWGIGQKGKDNGVAIIVAPQLRSVRIQVGTGLESILTDHFCQKIIDEIMIPLFKEGRLSQAIIDGMDTIIGELEFRHKNNKKSP